MLGVPEILLKNKLINALIAAFFVGMTYHIP
jgi:hypothetical protein